jgi:hypothetical protein
MAFLRQDNPEHDWDVEDLCFRNRSDGGGLRRSVVPIARFQAARWRSHSSPTFLSHAIAVRAGWWRTRGASLRVKRFNITWPLVEAVCRSLLNRCSDASCAASCADLIKAAVSRTRMLFFAWTKF